MARLPLVSPLDRILFLKGQPYLLGQPPELLTALASFTEERYFTKGAQVRATDGQVEEVLFLVDGQVGIGSSEAEDPAGRSVSAPGVIGLPHYFAGTRRPPGIWALQDTLCLGISSRDLEQIMEDYFSLALAFAKRSSEEALGLARSAGLDRPDEVGFGTEIQRETPVRLDIVERLALCRRAPLFKGVNLTVLGQLVRDEEIQRIAPGERLWRETDEIDRMAFVLDGELEPVGRFGSCRAGSGAVVGAWEILSDEPRAEGWEALSACRVLPIKRGLFIDLLEDHHDFAMDYLRCCAERVVSGWKMESGQSVVRANASMENPG